MKPNIIRIAMCSVALTAAVGAGAQIKLGNNPLSLDPSAVLELEGSNKALYLTRVALTSTTDLTTVPNPKAGMIVYNTNAAITGTPAAADGAGVYYFNGAAWAPGGPAMNSWNLSGNTGINPLGNFLGTTDAQPLTIRTANAVRGVFRPDGTMAFTNGVSQFPDNIAEFSLSAVGGPSTSGEQAQGVNVLATALGGSALSVALRGRISVPAGSSATEIRGASGVASVEGSLNSTGTGGYFNTSVKSGAALGITAILAGVASDVEASAGSTTSATNNFIGGRLNANAANATSVRTFGTFATAVNSATSNMGVFGLVNDPTFINYVAFSSLLPTGFGAAVAGYNPVAGANQYGAYFVGSGAALGTDGAVRMRNLTGAGTRMMTIDALGNVGSVAGFTSASASLTFAPAAAQSSSDQTIPVTGAALGDVVSLGLPAGAVLPNSSYSAWVSAAGVVTVRFNNYSTGAQTPPASQLFKVKVMP